MVFHAALRFDLNNDCAFLRFPIVFLSLVVSPHELAVRPRLAPKGFPPALHCKYSPSGRRFISRHSAGLLAAAARELERIACLAVFKRRS
jgi:hypothetical protein